LQSARLRDGRRDHNHGPPLNLPDEFPDLPLRCATIDQQIFDRYREQSCMKLGLPIACKMMQNDSSDNASK
jgi:hypothetical protein